MERRRFLILAGEATAGIALACSPASIPTAMLTERPKPNTEPTKPTRDQAELDPRLLAHDKFHYGERKNVPAVPSISIPFDNDEYVVAQAWEANQSEMAISKVTAHFGIDWKTKYGSNILCPKKGLAYASYQEGWRVINKEQIMHQGKKVAYAGGLFVEIIDEVTGRRVQMLHMASLDPGIPFSKPTPDSTGGWDPTGNNMTLDELKAKKLIVPVEIGQVLGTVGHSGLGLYDPEINVLGIYRGEDRPTSIPESAIPTWDPIGAHVHFEEFARNEKGLKFDRRDPYAIYSLAEDYPWPGHPKPLGNDPLLFVQNGQLKRAA